MRRRTNFILIIIGLHLFLDVYTYYGFRSLLADPKLLKIFTVLYLCSSAFVYYCLFQFYQGMQEGSFFRGSHLNFYIGIILTSLVSRIFFVGFLSIQDGGRFLIGAYTWITNLGGEKPEMYFPSRRKFLTMGAAVLGAIPLFSMIYGISKGKYNYKVNTIKLAFKDLPKAFDGFKIVQISDIHAGSLDNKEEFERGIALVNAQNPDLVVFTGDMINSEKEELDPWMESIGKLQANHGKYAVTGNHDYYGLYQLDDDDKEGKKAYMQEFFDKFPKMGFQLLNNSHEKISLGEDSITLVGVENWGKARWSPKYGDLEKAMEGVEEDAFTVMLTHDPTHWDEQILPHKKHVHLSVCGHTHGYQFGIKMPGFKWSPAQYSYPRWMGLYEEDSQYLYVNTGFGFLAFPGRVGMWPEISVFELSSVG